MMSAVLALRSFLITLAVLAAAVAPVGSASAEPDAPNEPKEAVESALDLSLTAHRGAPGHGVGENTFEAFRKAIAAGATAIETDVRRTKDNKLILLHDSGVGRTTNCRGPIPIWTRAQLDKRCREKFSKQPLPHFEELLEWMKRNKRVSLMVEPKGKSWTPLQLRRFVRTIRLSGVMDRVAVSSLRADHLRRIRRIAPNLNTQLIVSGWGGVQSTLGEVSGYNVPRELLTRARVKRLHKRGLRVIGGHSDRPQHWRDLAKLRVDGVVVPNVKRYGWYVKS